MSTSSNLSNGSYGGFEIGGGNGGLGLGNVNGNANGSEASIYAPNNNISRFQSTNMQRQYGSGSQLGSQSNNLNPSNSFYSNSPSVQNSTHSLPQPGSSSSLPKLSSAPPSIYDAISKDSTSSSPSKSTFIWSSSTPSSSIVGVGDKRRIENYLSPIGTRSSISTSSSGSGDLKGTLSASPIEKEEVSIFGAAPWNLGIDGKIQSTISKDAKDENKSNEVGN